VDTHDDGHEGF
jgi:hypothetical protein